ncbi:MAG: 16S rRNA (guanine(527)-N(7))-methyltransferase RsmG [Aphanocapsa feldmannii 277cV]|uniref:Ribosomal RNA small subunit methyltransferase G n=1 Tax=Aphanocapsa feldmannii 277cV TaxID=2507553 RepID=A0A524RQ98_9CHRO|nr:MAG: 16S rRNA (guanine(527)-N(7))-methyltransferase RsmG [Aphanocapsa feldmannii 277cV]
MAFTSDQIWSLLGWTPSADQARQFTVLQLQLAHWNRRLNLTRLVQADDYWIAQIYDALWPLLPQPQGRQGPRRIVDVGTGGGFPGLALAISLPQARLELVDSAARKCEAVRAMAHSLGLSSRVQVHCERAELFARRVGMRGQVDLAVARAVAPAPVVAEYLVPLLTPGGEALLYRGRWDQADEDGLGRAAALLGATLVRRQQRQLPAERGLRTVLGLSPTAPCPGRYPRKVGQPARRPLA